MTPPSSRTLSSSLAAMPLFCMRIASARAPKQAREARALHRYAKSSQCPFLLLEAEVRFFWLARVVCHHGNKQIGDARAAHLAQHFELVAVNAIEQQHAAPENRPL